MESLAKQKEYVNTFQIDDGYQTAVGDWLSIDLKKFPSGMKHIADSIHSKGFQAGIWLAPFGAQKNSKLAAEHPDWLIKDKRANPFPSVQTGADFMRSIFIMTVRANISKKFLMLSSTIGALTL